MVTSVSPARVEEPEAAGVLQLATELLIAVSTWPLLGVPFTLMPFTFATVGLVAVPPKSPDNSMSPGVEVVALLTVVDETVEGTHWLVVLS
jgi:hypothetical protein